jgi:hypothetical protein
MFVLGLQAASLRGVAAGLKERRGISDAPEQPMRQQPSSKVVLLSCKSTLQTLGQSPEREEEGGGGNRAKIQ